MKTKANTSVAVSFAELHEPIFLGTKNMPIKLDTHQNKDLKLTLFLLWGMVPALLVQWKEHSTVVQNYKHVIPANLEDIGFEPHLKINKPAPRPVQVSHPMKSSVPATAQVSTPHDHVFKERQ
jgi:hypothetical protein